MKDKIMVEIANYCENCYLHEMCPEDKCVLYRIETILLNKKGKRFMNTSYIQELFDKNKKAFMDGGINNPSELKDYIISCISSNIQYDFNGLKININKLFNLEDEIIKKNNEVEYEK